MSLPRFWLFLAVALPVLASLLAGLSSVDLSYHLRAGGEILDSRVIPNVDTWTYTAAGVTWVDQQWGSQVVFAVVDRLGGWTGLAVLRAALVGWTFGCLLLICRRRGLDERTSAILTLLAFFVAAVALSLRPQLLGMAAFAAVLVLVVDRRRHPGRLWLVPIITLVWANLHGSFFLAPVVLGLAWLEDLADGVPDRHHALLVAVVSAVAAGVTPFGPMVWVYAVGLSVNPSVTARITEWQPTSLRDAAGVVFFASALAVVALLARRGRPTPWPTLAWLAVFFLIGAYAVRGVAWWPLAAVVAVSGLIASVPDAADATAARTVRPTPPLSRRVNVLVAGLFILVGIALLPVWRPLDAGLGAPAGIVANAPPGITGALRETMRPGDRLFHPQAWGSWFETTFPEALVAIDSRIELFPSEVWDRYEAVMSGVEGWQRQLEDWGVTVVVTGGAATPGLDDRLASAGWKKTYQDADGGVFLRPGSR